jgi:hypothetical protein
MKSFAIIRHFVRQSPPVLVSSYDYLPSPGLPSSPNNSSIRLPFPVQRIFIQLHAMPIKRSSSELSLSPADFSDASDIRNTVKQQFSPVVTLKSRPKGAKLAKDKKDTGDVKTSQWDACLPSLVRNSG